MEKVAYLGLDAHARRCVLGHMDGAGNYVDEHRFETRESGLIRQVVAVRAKEKFLTVEEGPLAGWICRTLTEYVDV